VISFFPGFSSGLFKVVKYLTHSDGEISVDEDLGVSGLYCRDFKVFQNNLGVLGHNYFICWFTDPPTSNFPILENKNN
jgi:hypothetical protein